MNIGITLETVQGFTPNLTMIMIKRIKLDERIQSFEKENLNYTKDSGKISLILLHMIKLSNTLEVIYFFKNKLLEYVKEL